MAYKQTCCHTVLCTCRAKKSIRKRQHHYLPLWPELPNIVQKMSSISTAFLQIVSSLNSFCSLVRKVFKFSLHKGKLLRQLFEIFYIPKIEKRIVPSETICGNTMVVTGPEFYLKKSSFQVQWKEVSKSQNSTIEFITRKKSAKFTICERLIYNFCNIINY